jgi:hypothetical protein
MKPAAILLLAAAGIYAIGDAVLAPTPTPEHPGFVDAVLASRAVIAAIRLAIIFAGAFVVASVVALVRQERWLTRVGPVQVSEANTGEWQRKEIEQTREGLDKIRQKITRADDRPGEPRDANGRQEDS